MDSIHQCSYSTGEHTYETYKSHQRRKGQRISVSAISLRCHDIWRRMAMVGESCDALKKALTIAIHYSAVRRQFRNGGPTGEENKILDHQTHQARLFLPLLAITFALSATVHSRRAQEERYSGCFFANLFGDSPRRKASSIKCFWPRINAICVLEYLFFKVFVVFKNTSQFYS